jgi:hypothetical protein
MPGSGEEVDDTLQLYFLCAHPSLTPASAVALTLRAVGGLTTSQIARAYLVPEATMARRISRAKRTVSGVRFNQSGDVPRCCACSIWSSMRATPAMSTSPPRRSGSPANWRPRPTMRRSRAYLRSCRCTAHGVRHGPAPTAASCATEQDRSLWDTRLIAEGVDVLQAPSPATDWGSSRLCSPCCPVGPRPLPFKRPISRAPRHTRV